MEKTQQIPSDPEEARSTRVRRILQNVGAAIGIVLAGPALAAIFPVLVIGLFLGSCCAALIVSYPFVAGDISESRVTSIAEARVTGTARAQIESFRATVAAYPPPADVDAFVSLDDLIQWDFSPDGEYVALTGSRRLGVMSVATRQVYYPDLLDTFANPDVQYGNAVWLDERRLLVRQRKAKGPSYDATHAYHLVHIVGDAGPEFRSFALPEVRASEVTPSQLRGKDLFYIGDNRPFHQGVAVGEMDGVAVIAQGPDEEQVFRALIRGMTIHEIAPDSNWRVERPYEPGNRSQWHPLTRYDAPDGSYYAAVWPDGARLAILRSGGEIVVETLASEYGPPGADCRLVPLRWLPSSTGVSFVPRCMGTYHTVLLLTVPGR
jgi:hypothetical protein